MERLFFRTVIRNLNCRWHYGLPATALLWINRRRLDDNRSGYSIFFKLTIIIVIFICQTVVARTVAMSPFAEAATQSPPNQTTPVFEAFHGTSLQKLAIMAMNPTSKDFIGVLASTKRIRSRLFIFVLVNTLEGTGIWQNRYGIFMIVGKNSVQPVWEGSEEEIYSPYGEDQMIYKFRASLCIFGDKIVYVPIPLTKVKRPGNEFIETIPNGGIYEWSEKRKRFVFLRATSNDEKNSCDHIPLKKLTME